MTAISEGRAEIIMQPVRFKIIKWVSKSPEAPLYVEQLASLVKVSPRLVSHHLDVLEKSGLVECKFEIVNKKAVRMTFPTQKLHDDLKEIFTSLRQTDEKKEKP